MRKVIAIASLLFAGCAQSPKMVEGTTISLGAYIPWDGQMYGVEILSYVSGAVIKTPTNACYKISRKHSTTNDWCWGVLRSVETGDTRVEFSR